MPPVRPVGADLRDQESTYCQDKRHVDVACHVGTEWENRNKAEQVVDKNEEEDRQQVGHVL